MRCVSVKVPQVNECVLISALSAGGFHLPDFSLIFKKYLGSYSYLSFSCVLKSWTA